MVPKDCRGLVGGLIQGAFPIGFTVLSLVSTITLSITSHAQYCDWARGSNPALAKCAAAAPAMAANMQRANIGGVTPVARWPTQSKGT